MGEDDQAAFPREFHSEYEGRPFLCCTRCGERLQDFEQGFKVSKIYRNSEVTFEYALCFPCLEAMINESSEESRRRTTEFQEQRLREGITGTGECAFCERQRDGIAPDEFALVAACQGQRLLESHLICIHCMDEMSALVSKKTRDQWRKFVDENFPGCPPDFVLVPDERPQVPMVPF